MILNDKKDYLDLEIGSHNILNISCDLHISDKCRGSYRKEYRTIIRDRNRNDNKDICLYCSRELKFSGRSNPNCKYKNINDNYFNNIDTEFKAYILGYAAGDGHLSPKGSLAIEIGEVDETILGGIRSHFDEIIPIKQRDGKVCLTINSKQIVNDMCEHLGIKPGNKSHTVKFPKLSSDELTYAFIRGLFDSDGSVSDPRINKTRYPKANITTVSKEMLGGLSSYIKIPHSTTNDQIIFSGNNALDFMYNLYDKAKIYLSRKRDLYLDWAMWVPSLGGNGTYGKEILFKWNKTRADAIPPSKARASDSGYDLVVLEKVKQFGQVELWDTGVKILPDYGWYFDMVPRSSIIKTGYMLANSVGIIDRTYTGNVMVPLIKIDPNSPALQAGARVVQIIPRPVVHVEIEEIDDIEDTDRADGGFGSTGV